MLVRQVVMIALAAAFGLAAQEAPVASHESEVVATISAEEEMVVRNDECSSRRCPQQQYKSCPEKCEKKCDKRDCSKVKRTRKGAAKKVVDGE